MRALTRSAVFISAALSLSVCGAAGAAATAPTASAAVTCSGEGCSGTSPETTGCANDGETIFSTNLTTSSGQVVGLIQLRYSATCRTAWARIYDFDTTSGWAKVIRAPQGPNLKCNETYNAALDEYTCYTDQWNDANPDEAFAEGQTAVSNVGATAAY
jgi:hypothetical protein